MDMRCHAVLFDGMNNSHSTDKELDWRIRPLDETLKYHLTCEAVNIGTKGQKNKYQPIAEGMLAKALYEWRE